MPESRLLPLTCTVMDNFLGKMKELAFEIHKYTVHVDVANSGYFHGHLVYAGYCYQFSHTIVLITVIILQSRCCHFYFS